MGWGLSCFRRASRNSATQPCAGRSAEHRAVVDSNSLVIFGLGECALGQVLGSKAVQAFLHFDLGFLMRDLGAGGIVPNFANDPLLDVCKRSCESASPRFPHLLR